MITVNELNPKYKCVNDLSAGLKNPALIFVILLWDKSKTLIFEWYIVPVIEHELESKLPNMQLFV